MALIIAAIAFAFLGVSPFGEKSTMIVDMHHQYAPLLAQLRERIINFDNPFYAFDVGLGTNWLPLFAYYLASPLNLLLVLFSPEHLTDAIFVITLIKIALCAASFAACVQYVYRRRGILIVPLSLMYALSMYVIAYSWNIMWLDGVIMLPIVVMAFERLMRTGKFSFYVLSLAYALYVNYYIAFMLCLFLVLYYVFYSLRTRRDFKTHRQNLLRFGLGSLLAAGLAAFLLLPVYLSLGQTSASTTNLLPPFAANFDLFNLLGRHLPDVSPTIRSGNLPNIYTGMLTVLLVPLFMTTKTIPVRRRVAWAALLIIMVASFTINQWDLIWHGLHSPNDLPYRFAFIYTFVVLIMSFEALCHLKDFTLKQIGAVVAGVIGVIILIEFIGGDEISVFTVYLSLALTLLYGLILAIEGYKLKLHTAYLLITVFVAIELIASSGIGLHRLDAAEYFTSYNDFVANDTTRAMRQSVNVLTEIGDQQADGAFYRLETLPRRTTTDTALFNYRGISVFASSNSYTTTRFMGSLGYAVNGVNSYLYHNIVPPVDSLFGVRYVAIKDQSNLSSAGWPELDRVTVSTETFRLFENPDALPVGYWVRPETRDFMASYYNPFNSQNRLFRAMTGINDDIYTLYPMTADSNQVSDYGDMRANTFTATLDQAGRVFIYVDYRAATTISVFTDFKVDPDGHNGNWHVTSHEPHMINAGRGNIGDTVTVQITAHSASGGGVYVAMLNESVYQAAMEQLASGGLHVTDFSDGYVKGDIDAPADGLVFTSIPYDAGWSVKVDGQTVETADVGQTDGGETTIGAFLAFPITAGKHSVELSFTPQGLTTGIAISLSSLLIFAVLVWQLELRQLTKYRKSVKSTKPAKPTIRRPNDAPKPSTKSPKRKPRATR